LAGHIHDTPIKTSTKFDPPAFVTANVYFALADCVFGEPLNVPSEFKVTPDGAFPEKAIAFAVQNSLKLSVGGIPGAHV